MDRLQLDDLQPPHGRRQLEDRRLADPLAQLKQVLVKLLAVQLAQWLLPHLIL
ncbi:MAG: hypothetical protein F6K28_38795 [Microcoleus sp. SIO2G3]|nr:hypothetical protein [Microcoleus sp. SIO2G3]